MTPLITGLTKNQVLGLRIFTVVEFLSFIFFITANMQKKKGKNFIYLSVPILLAVALIDYSLNPTNQFDSLPSGFAAITGITCCIYCLFLLIRKATTIFLYQIPFFWFISGIFIFYSGTLFLFLLSQQNLNTPSFANAFIIINSGFSILRNILFSFAFFISTPREFSEQSLL